MWFWALADYLTTAVSHDCRLLRALATEHRIKALFVENVILIIKVVFSASIHFLPSLIFVGEAP